jgi:hypothetical protein
VYRLIPDDCQGEHERLQSDFLSFDDLGGQVKAVGFASFVGDGCSKGNGEIVEVAWVVVFEEDVVWVIAVKNATVGLLLNLLNRFHHHCTDNLIFFILFFHVNELSHCHFRFETTFRNTPTTDS